MFKKIFIFILPLVIVSIFGFHKPTLANDSITNSNSKLFVSPVIAALKYEAKDPTSLQNPITDPNFNVMREKELGKSLAIPLVVGVLIIAVIAPIAAWIYFSN